MRRHKPKSKSNPKKEIFLAAEELEGRKGKQVLGEQTSKKPKAKEVIYWLEENSSNADVDKLQEWIKKEYGSELSLSETSELLLKALKKSVG